MAIDDLEISADLVCPCSSGRRYGACCRPKGLRWYTDTNGDSYQETPMNQETREALESAIKRASLIFDRELEPDDPIFPERFLLSEADVEDDVLGFLEMVNAPPEIVYAYSKTGWLILDNSNPLIRDGALLEWNRAIAEYHTKSQEVNSAGGLEQEELEIEIWRLPFIWGRLILCGDGKRAWKALDAESNTRRIVVLYYSTRGLKTLRAANVLIGENFHEDALNLARSVYECFLHILLAIDDLEELVNVHYARFMLAKGEFSYSTTRKGSIDRGKIIDPKTGRVYRCHLSGRRLASLSPFPEDPILYEAIYSHLSGFEHPDLSATFHCYYGDVGFDHRLRNLDWHSRIMLLLVGMITLDATLQIGEIQQQARRDVVRFLRRTSIKLLRYLESTTQSDFDRSYAQTWHRRISRVGLPWNAID